MPTPMPPFASVMKRPRSDIPRRRRMIQELGKAPSASERMESFKLDSFHRRSSIDFVNRVKDRFTGNPHHYKEFLRAIVEYSRGNPHVTWNLCVKIVDVLFGHADLIIQFQGFFDEKLRREVQRDCGFAVDDKLNEIEVKRYRLKCMISCAEDALLMAPPELVRFIRDECQGYKLAVIKDTYGERGEEVIEFLRKDPKRALPVILERLREEDRAFGIIREAALDFLGEFRALSCKRGLKRKLRPD